MYFGSQNGIFRIYPARQSEECGVYDPRVRPWFVAGSSGPKNVVLILDDLLLTVPGRLVCEQTRG